MPGVMYLYIWEGENHYIHLTILPSLADSWQETEEIDSTEASASGHPKHITAQTGNLYAGMKPAG
jgi:hypothetical protein